MNETLASYMYEALLPNHIRLLYPIFKDDELSWSLKVTNLEDGRMHAFDALSYFWGKKGETFAIIVDEKELRIHGNLNDALPFLARRSSPLPIWIDAICINQADDKEKMIQIALMCKIYTRASQVWVWLGCPDNHILDAIALLPQIAKVGEQLEKLPFWERRSTFESASLPPLSSPIWRTVLQLISHPWYRRVWVVQEAALAKEIKGLCGSFEIEWEVLGDAVMGSYYLADFLNENEDLDQILPSGGLSRNRCVSLIRWRVHAPDPIISQESTSSRLLGILTHMLKQDCSDPRDRVLGVLGLFGDEVPEEFIFEDKTGFVEMYTRFFRFLFTSVDSTDRWLWFVFSLATFSDRVDGLPSWCPNLHHEFKKQGLDSVEPFSIPVIGYTQQPAFRASLWQNRIRQGSEIRSLVLTGTIFDRVESVYPQMPSFPRPGESNERITVTHLLDLAAWETSLFESVVGLLSDLQLQTKKIWSGDYWRTLIASFTEGRGGIITDEIFAEFHASCERLSKLRQQHGVETYVSYLKFAYNS